MSQITRSPVFFWRWLSFSLGFLLSQMRLEKFFLLPLTSLAGFDSSTDLSFLTKLLGQFLCIPPKLPVFASTLCRLPFCIWICPGDLCSSTLLLVFPDVLSFGFLLSLEEVILEYQPTFHPIPPPLWGSPQGSLPGGSLVRPKSVLLESGVLLAVHHSCCPKDLELRHFVDAAAETAWQEELLPKHWDHILLLCTLSTHQTCFCWWGSTVWSSAFVTAG